MSQLTETLPARALGWLARAVFRHPRWFFYPQVLLFVAAVYFTIHHLKIDTDRDNLVGSDKKYHRNYLAFRKEFPRQDDLVAVIESEDLEKNRQFAERFGARLRSEPDLFVDVLYNNDIKMLGNRALLFFPEGDLGELSQTLKDYKPFLVQFSQATNLNSLFRLVNRQFRTAKQEQNADNDSMVKALPALERIVRLGIDSLQRPGLPPSPGLTALFNAGSEAIERQYITFNKGRIFIVTAHAKSDTLNERAVERMREFLAQTQSEVPGVNTAITGEPVLEVDEMRQSERDTTVATVVSLLICALIFIYGYQETGRPLKATACLVFGLGYTMGYATLVVGHLNILTITFVPMLIGMAIDFGVHLITRFEEELRRGRTVELAMQKAMVNTGLGIFTGAFTTAGAFFAMGITRFKGIQEMGIITGGGMLVCLVPMMTLLPILLIHSRQNSIDQHTPDEPADDTHRARIERLWLERPRLASALTLGLCAACVLVLPKVRFDYNLLNMQTRGLPAVVFERKLIDTADKSVLFGVVVCNSLSNAVATEARLTNLTTVASVDSMARFLAENHEGKLSKIRDIRDTLASIHFAPYDTQPASARELSQTLTYLRGYLGLAADTVHRENDPELERQLRSLGEAVRSLAAKLANGDTTLNGQRLAAYQQALFRDIHETFDILSSQEAKPHLTPEDLPPALRNRFIGVTGKHLLQVNPKEDVWQRDQQERFVKDLRTVDPDATGTPIQLFEYTTLLKDSYIEAAWWSLGAIAILVFLHFRNPLSVILALIPVAIGTLYMVGFMVLFKIPFNPANIMTLPLVVGIGVTNGIHILNRFAEEQNPGILAKSTGKAVIVSALTTIAGFGSLILAKHQGIQSLGFVMAVGTATCMISAVVFLPALLNLLHKFGPSRPKTPAKS